MIRSGLIFMCALGCEFASDGPGGDDYWTCDNAPPEYAAKAHCPKPTPPDTGHTVCYFPSSGAMPGAPPSATVQYQLDSMAGVDVVHVALFFDRGFVDNTYGTTAIGWGAHGHKFMDLVGSDHAELKMSDTSGHLVLDFKLDYISADATAASGYRDLGVKGGDGGMVVGDPAAVVATLTSLDQNLNQYPGYLVNSPATDANYTPNPAAPDWRYDVIYEAWVALSAFGTAGFGDVQLEFVHASPSKLGTSTITVTPQPCPPNWVP